MTLEELKEQINDAIRVTPDYADPTMALSCDVVSNLIGIIEKQNASLDKIDMIAFQCGYQSITEITLKTLSEVSEMLKGLG